MFKIFAHFLKPRCTAILKLEVHTLNPRCCCPIQLADTYEARTLGVHTNSTVHNLWSGGRRAASLVQILETALNRGCVPRQAYMYEK